MKAVEVFYTQKSFPQCTTVYNARLYMLSHTKLVSVTRSIFTRRFLVLLGTFPGVKVPLRDLEFAFPQESQDPAKTENISKTYQSHLLLPCAACF